MFCLITKLINRAVGYESVKLALKTNKIKNEHNWTPLISFELAVKLTAGGTRRFEGADSANIIKNQIENVIEEKLNFHPQNIGTFVLSSNKKVIIEGTL